MGCVLKQEMKKEIFGVFIVAIIFCSCKSSQEVHTIYEYGAYYNGGDSCTVACRKQYGYKTKDVGCSPLGWQLRNNRQVKRQLKRRNGAGWEPRLNADIEKCRNKH